MILIDGLNWLAAQIMIIFQISWYGCKLHCQIAAILFAQYGSTWMDKKESRAKQARAEYDGEWPI
jgi:hypothetical protein